MRMSWNCCHSFFLWFFLRQSLILLWDDLELTELKLKVVLPLCPEIIGVSHYEWPP